MKENKNTYIALLCFVLALFACKSTKPKELAEIPEKTAFYTIELTRDTIANKTSAVVKNINVVDSKVRHTIDETKTKGPNYLKIQILYKNNKVVNLVTEHPLYKHFDLYSESGKIESKLISLSQDLLIFRAPYFDQFKKITILETINFKESAPIILKK
ncbi:hypothetical protein CNR22_07395 [Sphingobacteriaceae bacterium]|nr:hypothetical protein CNR22_07395 [Sphingobacteriaceae bacterium]